MPHGKICYLEIPAITAEASADFYRGIFGWTIKRRGDGELAFDDSGGVSGTWVKESDRTPDEQHAYTSWWTTFQTLSRRLRLQAAAC
jgi:predicted enzyme related to lactoylglutathione lyase